MACLKQIFDKSLRYIIRFENGIFLEKMNLMVCSALPLGQQLFHRFQYQRLDIMLEVTNLKGICGFCNQNQNQNQNNFISETYNVSNIKINLLLMGANSWKPI